MKDYIFKFLLFLNLSGRYATHTDFSQTEIQYLESLSNVVIKDSLIYLNSFDDLKMINAFSEKRLYDTLKKTLKLLNLIPGIKQVAICNSFAFRNQNLNSDLDLFLILDHKIFYTSRLLIIFLLSIFNLKRTSKKFVNKVCLSFLISDKNLNLSKVRFQNDYYFKFWLDNLVFLGNDKILKNKFLNINRAIDFNSNFFLKIAKPPLYFKPLNFNFLCKLLSVFEPINKFFQMKRAYRKFNQLDKPFGIYIRDGFLKFHNQDIRPEFNKRYGKYLKIISFG